MAPGKREAITAELRRRALAAGPDEFVITGLDVESEFEVAKGTALAALRPLVDEGLLYAHHGVSGGRAGGGYYRRSPLLVRRLASDRLSRDRRQTGSAAVEADAESSGTTWKSDVYQTTESDDVPDHVVEILGAGPHLVRRRRVYMDDTIVQLKADSWIPLDIATSVPQVRQTDTGPGGMYARYEDAGIMLTRFTEKLQARYPTPDEAELLDGGPPVVVDLVRTAWAGDRPVEVMTSTVRAESFQFEYSFPAD